MTAAEWEQRPLVEKPGQLHRVSPSTFWTTLYVPWSPMTLNLPPPRRSTLPPFSSLWAFSIIAFSGRDPTASYI